MRSAHLVCVVLLGTSTANGGLLRRQSLRDTICFGHGNPPSTTLTGPCAAGFSQTLPPGADSSCVRHCDCHPDAVTGGYTCAKCCGPPRGGFTCGADRPFVRLGNTSLFVEDFQQIRGCVCDSGFFGPQCQFTNGNLCNGRGSIVITTPQQTPCFEGLGFTQTPPRSVIDGCGGVSACNCTRPCPTCPGQCTMCCARDEDSGGQPVCRHHAPIPALTPTTAATPAYSSTGCTCNAGFTGATCHLTASPSVTPSPTVRVTPAPSPGRSTVLQRCDGRTFYCTCPSGFGGINCTLTSDNFCNGRGVPTAGGDPRCTNCTGRNTHLSTNCDCEPFWVGADCATFDSAAALEDEDKKSKLFILVAVILFTLFMLFMLGASCIAGIVHKGDSDDDDECTQCLKFSFTRFALSGIQTWDWVSDVGFVAISMQSARFREAYSGSMGDVASYSVFSVVLSAFLWAGMQLCLLGVEEFRMRSFCPPLPVEGDGERVQWHRLATLAVFVVEDVPQIFFQAVYFGTLGLDGGDAAAINALLFTIVSVLYSAWYLLNVQLCPDGEIYSADGISAAVAAKKGAKSSADRKMVRNDAYGPPQPKAQAPPKGYPPNSDDNLEGYGF